jgi:hypothetical protein
VKLLKNLNLSIECNLTAAALLHMFQGSVSPTEIKNKLLLLGLGAVMGRKKQK